MPFEILLQLFCSRKWKLFSNIHATSNKYKIHGDLFLYTTTKIVQCSVPMLGRACNREDTYSLTLNSRGRINIVSYKKAFFGPVLKLS